MKPIILFVLALFVSTLAFGQVEFKPTIGLNITNASEDPLSGKADGQAGWQFGASFLFGNKFYIEPGVHYLQRSIGFSSETIDELNFDATWNGLRIPVALGLHLLGSEESTAALRAFGGASAFILTGVDAGIFDKDDFESPTWGVFAGAGLDIWILFVDLKYEWSLTDVASIDDFNLGQKRSLFANAGIRLAF